MSVTPVIPLILCGGAGARLWPLSTEDRPKQFLRLAGEHTLFGATLRRAAAIPAAARAIVVASAKHHALVRSECAEAQSELAGLILEPFGKNTTAAVTAGALSALAGNPDAIMLVLPSDHVIGDENVFQRAIALARSAAEGGKLVALGIQPSRPETGYGYIRRGQQLGDGLFAIDRFIEKPNEERARSMLAQGGHLWNAGIFVFSARTILNELEIHCPAIVQNVKLAMAEGARAGAALTLESSAFARCESLPIDVAVMEKTSAGAVVPSRMDWSDLGSWAAVYDVLPKDANGNAVIGTAHLNDCHDCLIIAERNQIGASGLHHTALIESPNGVLSLPLSRAQDVRRIAEAAGRPSLNKE